MRLLINFLITTCVLFFFNGIGWLSISHEGHKVDLAHLTLPTFGKVLLLAVVIWFLNICIGGLLGALTPDNLPFGCLIGAILLIFPFVGCATLALIAHFAPGTLELNGFWITLLCGGLLLIMKIPRQE